ncbi:MAG: Mu-like prophage major head subunit gpT family protein [Capsulimonadaceae bacterium]|nr:Mu-like prophage major head subunit gpT family protein [Capsulimonadaceae bacterium]
MAVVTSDVLALTFAGVKTEFDAAYIRAQEQARWRLIAEEIPTTLPIQNYAWLGRGAVMQEFVDEVAEQSLFEKTYTLADKIYKGNLTVWRKTLEDDQYGLLMKKARDLAQEPVRHWNQLAFTGLASGFSSLCYDDSPYFSASHQEGDSPVQTNATGSSLSDAALQAAEAAMMSYVDDKGRPLEIVPDTLVVGPALKRVAEDLVGSSVVITKVGDGTAGAGATASTSYDNYFRGKYNVVVSPYLINGTIDDATYNSAYNWFLLDTSRSKPIVIQNRQDVPVTLETDMDQPSAKIKERYNISIRGRYVQGYGLWQTAYGSNATS